MPLLSRRRQVTDEARFRSLFDDHYRAIARFFRMRGHDAADADDLVAATFEVAWRKLDAVPAGDEAAPWLFGVARNQSRNARRKLKREAAFVDDFQHTVAAATEMQLEGREEFAATMRALTQLKPLDRDLILLVTWDELSPTDAGQVLGLRPNAARTRLHRARKQLAALLEADGQGPDGPGAGGVT